MASGSPDVSNSFFSPYSNSFVSHCGWWCPAFRMSPIRLSPLMAIHLSPIVAGGVRLSGCLHIHLSPLWRQFTCLPVWLVASGSPDISNSLSPLIANHLSPSLAGGVRLSICFPLQQFLCLPVWLVVSGSPDVCNSCVFPCRTAIHMFPSLAGGVRLSACRFPVASKISQLLPSLLHLLSSLPPVSQVWSPSCLLDVSQVRLPRCCLPVASKVSALVV